MLYRSYVFVRINLCRTHYSFIILLIVCQIFSCIVSQFISWCKKLLILHYKAVSQNCTIEKYFMMVINMSSLCMSNKNLTQNYCLRHLKFLTTKDKQRIPLIDYNRYVPRKQILIWYGNTKSIQWQ